ncbi:MAG: tRNA pseudouridine(38-40) synthase TruA [Roseovarius sp.]|nr:tRNA pseudouridine(38-40) synthase TruA [Roseovarius sp.]
MPRFALKIEYKGTPFSGWQRQQKLPTVQGAIENALSALEPGTHTIYAAGRTDTGVHALAQVAHADLEKDWEPSRLSKALNHHLRPLPISILICNSVNDGWHARFSAIERHYFFRLLMRSAPATFDRDLVWQVPYPLDIDTMREAAAHLTGLHDFTTFRSSSCQAESPVKTLDQITIETIESRSGTELQFHLRARSFLHRQVRSIVGTLERVGAGAWSPDDVKSALESRDRASCGPVSPPQGLFLADVSYPNDPFINLEQRFNKAASFRRI